jgi:hypothetical protein
MRRFSAPAVLAALAMAATGCVITSPPPGGNNPDANLPGDISFDWSFDGENRCSVAGVAEIDIQVFGPAETLVFQDTVECLGGGLTLRDFDPGRHELLLDAYDSFGELAYFAEAITLTVEGGRDNHLGTVDFLPAQGARTGSIASFWSFKYPTDESTVLDCAVAGVDDMLVEITPLDSNAAVFTETFDCAAEGFVVDGMTAGDYEVTFLALFNYDGEDLPMYTSTTTVTVTGGAESDLGDVRLDRVFESFADIEVSWGFGAGDCASRGVSELEISIVRLEGDLEDDSFTAACDTVASRRNTFVPGGYVVTARGVGSGNVEYVGTRTLEVGPNQMGNAVLEMVLAN